MHIYLAINGLLQEFLQVQTGIGVKVAENNLVMGILALEIELQTVVFLIVRLLSLDVTLLVADIVATADPAGFALVLVTVGVVQYLHAVLELGVRFGLSYN